ERRLKTALPATVLMVSTPVADGHKSDAAGRSVVDGLTQAGFDPIDYRVLPDDPGAVDTVINEAVSRQTALIVTVGGTGIGPKDKVVETIEPKLTTPMPGLMEAARAFGQKRTPYAVLSRGVSGFIGSSLTLTFPGSRAGAQETLAALLPSLIHIVEIHRRFAGKG
ncbi:MAG: molybdopterin-binding protein, partial [Salinisphaera sp.]|uniref:molybdopterin-binding protein n=1 Tax=Salinisphaera sp. TaxID=1914330 RepID=UPI003C7BCFE0